MDCPPVCRDNLRALAGTDGPPWCNYYVPPTSVKTVFPAKVGKGGISWYLLHVHKNLLQNISSGTWV